MLFAPIFHRDRLAPEERLDLAALADDLTRAGTPAEPCATIDEVERRALALVRPGDVIVAMSSGSFAGLPGRLARALESRAREGGLEQAAGEGRGEA